MQKAESAGEGSQPGGRTGVKGQCRRWGRGGSEKIQSSMTSKFCREGWRHLLRVGNSGETAHRGGWVSVETHVATLSRELFSLQG